MAYTVWGTCGCTECGGHCDKCGCDKCHHEPPCEGLADDCCTDEDDNEEGDRD
jgi:hypothetical protein